LFQGPGNEISSREISDGEAIVFGGTRAYRRFIIIRPLIIDGRATASAVRASSDVS
jgi:hypothetical protein